jgi:hypothetical protein
MLNVWAAGIYLLTAAAAIAAASRDHSRRRFAWTSVGVAFTALAAWRLAGGEAALQELLRSAAAERNLYDERGEVQRPLIAFALLLGAPATVLLWRKYARDGARTRLAVACIAASILVGYTVIRAVSLHAVDALIYQSIGPVHVNYLIDGGLTLACLIAGVSSALRPPAGRRCDEKKRKIT